jgi:L-proline amide hydrolase
MRAATVVARPLVVVGVERRVIGSGPMAQLDWEGLTTWYDVHGEPGDRLPVVLCHGGPGATHDYLLSLRALATDGRQVVLYDQVGNGNSQHLRDAPADFWTVDLFRRELHALVEHLGWSDGYHVLGQSWGGMLAMEHALEHPPGLRSIVVADSPASISLWVAEANRLREELPTDVQDALTRHEAAGSTDSPEYREAMQVFYRRHVCRLDPWPEEVVRTFDLMDEDPTVYGTMNGPSEFHVVGTIRDRIRNVQWVLLEESSHLPHVEEPERFVAAVEGFLERVETR